MQGCRDAGPPGILPRSRRLVPSYAAHDSGTARGKRGRTLVISAYLLGEAFPFDQGPQRRVGENPMPEGRFKLLGGNNWLSPRGASGQLAPKRVFFGLIR